MNLIDYGRILLRRGWIMVLVALIAATSAYVLSSRQTPQYRATQYVLIQPARTDNGLTLAIIQLMNSYQVYLNSSERAQQVIDALKLDMLAADLLTKVQIVTNRDNLTVQIDVTLPDPQIAGDVARTWGDLLVQYRIEQNQTARQEDRVSAILPDKAIVGLFSPRPAINAAAGGILGLVLGGIIVFALEYLESSIVRRRDDIERALDLPVLATLPDLER
jgi:capsular polysaccharide biosynthesis protein